MSGVGGKAAHPVQTAGQRGKKAHVHASSARGANGGT